MGRTRKGRGLSEKKDGCFLVLFAFAVRERHTDSVSVLLQVPLLRSRAGGLPTGCPRPVLSWRRHGSRKGCPMRSIALIPQATLLGVDDVARCASALQTQVSRDF